MEGLRRFAPPPGRPLRLTQLICRIPKLCRIDMQDSLGGPPPRLPNRYHRLYSALLLICRFASRGQVFRPNILGG